MPDLPSPELIAKYDVPGPRYTSYPSAVEWSETFREGQYLERLARADQQKGPLSLYVHLPFCREMCRFCGCNMVATHDRSRADRYLGFLEREVELVAERLPHRRTVSQLHWGGGTPTFLDAEQLLRCHALLARHFRFSPEAEKAVEVDPAVTSALQIDALAALGFNRISMGVQDFDPQVQAAVRRVQGERETAWLVGTARRAGFQSVNIDLIYGLPYQTPESWRRTLERVVAMRPDRIATFGFAYVPWAKPNQRLLPREALPGPSQRIALFLEAVETLGRAGYRLIGLDHFALEKDELARAQIDGRLTRNFQGYTVRPATDTVAFGMSAISDVAGAYAQNARRLKDWEARVTAGVLPIERGFCAHRDDLVRRFAIDRVMCTLRLDLRQVEAELGRAARLGLEESLWTGAAPLIEDGLITFDGDVLRVQPLGRLLIRNVAMLFDAYLAKPKDGSQFSQTV